MRLITTAALAAKGRKDPARHQIIPRLSAVPNAVQRPVQASSSADHAG